MNNTIFTAFPQLNSDTIYLDSGASSLTPRPVIEAMNDYYQHYRANIHRGLYAWSQKATEKYEQTRDRVAHFLGASRREEIIFTRGTTDGINLLAEMLKAHLKPGQNIILPVLEHHSNLLPWRTLAARTKCQIHYIGLVNGSLDLHTLLQTIDTNTALVAVAHISNVLGSIQDIQTISQRVHQVGGLCLVDGAQAVAHIPVSVQDLGCDAYVFSGHKMYGPTGVGIIWAKYQLLEQCIPHRTGGDMVEFVSKDRLEYAPIPQRFEPGTPAIAEIIGLGAAIDWLKSIAWSTIVEHEQDLVNYAWQAIQKRAYLTVLGPDSSQKRSGTFAFTMSGVHSHDIAHLLAEKNICVRAGHHCAGVLGEYLGISGSTRASFGIYNQRPDIDILMQSLDEIYQLFKV